MTTFDQEYPHTRGYNVFGRIVTCFNSIRMEYRTSDVCSVQVRSLEEFGGMTGIAPYDTGRWGGGDTILGVPLVENPSIPKGYFSIEYLDEGSVPGPHDRRVRVFPWLC